ncbi:alpha/beta-type small acid-soluble spore protein [Tepidibacter aestuarii]|uniref:alpha/beta-type small acid-soluble spore protein n=1 Tax=Tepidibacter aestuarii TaxID=2925782 RepID=UPI0020BDEE7D|nr:alpha/beta-type small acid-soluble spore protein [Tepidibacter aestuarii]CAH2214797.1 Small, acid-soluble spore protein beta [Tepidibacter aestuarii]
MVKGPVDQNAMKALNQMKYEIANELGITDELSNNKGTLSAGKNAFFGGYVGGQMTKKLVEMAEKQLINKK